MRAVYFGCWKQPGHGYYGPGMQSLDRDATPWRYGIDGKFTPLKTLQGEAALHWSDGWTILAVHDYTADHRPGSHSTFAFDALLTADEAMAAAHEHFPEVIARVGDIRCPGPSSGEGQ